MLVLLHRPFSLAFASNCCTPRVASLALRTVWYCLPCPQRSCSVLRSVDSDTRAAVGAGRSGGAEFEERYRNGRVSWSEAGEIFFSRQAEDKESSDGDAGVDRGYENSEKGGSVQRMTVPGKIEKREEAALRSNGNGVFQGNGRRAVVGQERWRDRKLEFDGGQSWSRPLGEGKGGLSRRAYERKWSDEVKQHRSFKGHRKVLEGEKDERMRSRKLANEATSGKFEVEKKEWKRNHSTPALKIKGEPIYGVGPIYAALQVCRRELYCLYVQENMRIEAKSGKKKDMEAFRRILQAAIDKGIEMKEMSKHDLNLLVDNRPHQGLVLDASPLELVLVNSLESPSYDGERAPVWVALDEVTDPQNFGAVLRSSYFLGASGVVVCARNSAPLSGVVSKASAGALEVMEVRSCRNMVKFLERSMENGWRTVGASAQANAIPARNLPHCLPTILVLGSEGRGLRTNVKRACKEMVCIPGGFGSNATEEGSSEGDINEVLDGSDYEDEMATCREESFIAVESLNVSVAAGILLYELLNGPAPQS